MLQQLPRFLPLSLGSPTPHSNQLISSIPITLSCCLYGEIQYSVCRSTNFSAIQWRSHRNYMWLRILASHETSPNSCDVSGQMCASFVFFHVCYRIEYWIQKYRFICFVTESQVPEYANSWLRSVICLFIACICYQRQCMIRPETHRFHI